MTWYPEHVYIDPEAEHDRHTRLILNRLPSHVRWSIEKAPARNFVESKKTLYLTRHKGAFIKKCPGIHKTVCCNYYTINPISNCHYNCSYCFLQTYVENNPTYKVYVNLEDLFDELRQVLAQKQFARIGTGELSDSLNLDHLTHHSRLFAEFLLPYKGVTLELKTKSTNIDLLLKRPAFSNTVIAWSITPPEVSQREEHGTPDVFDRIHAAGRVAAHGYMVGLHFDPMVAVEGWENEYAKLLDLIFSQVPPRRLAWVSMGSLRFHSELKSKAYDRFPDTNIFSNDFVRSEDGKFRYFFSLRQRLFRTLRKEFERRAPRVPVYLCMEGPEVWDGAMNESQGRLFADGSLDSQFRKRLEHAHGCGSHPSRSSHRTELAQVDQLKRIVST